MFKHVHIGIEIYVHVLVKYQSKGTYAYGWCITTVATKLSEQLEVMNGVKLVSGNITKPINGEVGKRNPNLGRRTIVQKAIVPTPLLQETNLKKGTMK
jgi:hypothetical protein